MKKELNVIGLDCGHCALILEKYLQSVKGVNSCSVNFSTSKVFLDIEDDGYKRILKEVYKLSKQVNPDVTFTEEKMNDNNVRFLDIFLYIIGLVLGIATIFVSTPKWLYHTLLLLSAVFLGYKTYLKALRQIIHFKVNENTLITMSIIGACLIGESMEGLMVIALYTLGKFLERKAVNYSRKSISKLISSQPEYANLFIDGKKKRVKPEMVKVDDLIMVSAGEKIPLDAIVVDGIGCVDKKHLTGESFLVEAKVGDVVEGGSILIDSTLILKVICEYKDSTLSKILNLITNASNKKSKTESFISKFSGFYTLGVIVFSVIVFGITWIVVGDVLKAFYRGLVFLVVSCPCAFAISVPLSYFGGIGRCSKEGILIKGSSYLDVCAKLNRVVFDKTGTLTTGEFSVVKVECDKDNLFELLDVVYSGEINSIHPIAKAICKYIGNRDKLKIIKYKEIAGVGIEFVCNKSKYTIGRGISNKDMTIVVIDKNNKEFGKIYLKDEVKEHSFKAVHDIKKLHVKTMMLSGDNNCVTKNVAKYLNIDEYRSKLKPQDKFRVLQELKEVGERVLFVGDGINDAPALTISDVGVGMGIMGSPATIECSDVVITDDNLTKIPTLIKISKRTKRIVIQNIIFAGVTKFTFLLLGALGITGMLLAVFADVGVTLLAILNSLRILSAKDK